MSARALAEETAGNIMMRMPVVFKSDLRSEITKMLFPLCLKITEVSEGIKEISRCLGTQEPHWDVPDFFPHSWARGNV